VDSDDSKVELIMSASKLLGGNRVKFTVGRVSNFECEPGKKDQLLWDSDEKTLCLRARQAGGKSYYFQSRYAGRVIKIKLGNFTDKKLTISDVRRKAREYQAQIDSGIDPRLEIKRSVKREQENRVELRKREITLQAVWEEYVEENKAGWSDNYLLDHFKSMNPGGQKRKRLDKKTVPGVLSSLAGYRLEQITPQVISSWIKREKLTRPTVTARGFRMLRACLNWANGQDRYYGILDMSRISGNTDIRKAMPKSKARNDALEKSHLPLWFSAMSSINNPVIGAYLQALLLTGARREEMAQLKWEDVDFKWMSIRIRDKVDGERVIPLTPYVANLIMVLPRRNEWVFSSLNSKSGRLTDAYKSHSTVIAAVGLPHISIHGLRRSFGSLSEWVECPVGIVAQIQGHKPSAIAEKHYRVRPLDLLRVWHCRIEKLILEFAEITTSEVNSNSLHVVS